MVSNNTEFAAQASTGALLDLRLDALASLRWPNKLVTEDVAVSGRVWGWKEQSAVDGEYWLRHSAAEGNWHAMECLGLRLINGNGLTKSLAEGLDWLRRAAELGSPTAMACLAESMLDGEQSRESRAEAEGWLQKAIHHGSLGAAIILGTRLITGTGLAPDPERGKELLLRAAHDGSQLAHIKLGVYLLSGRGLPQDKQEGLRWLWRLGVTQQVSLLGYYVYLKSLSAPTQGAARLLAEEAGVLFHESMQHGNKADEVNLAYLLRRQEISAARYPSLDSLLSSHLQQNRPFALINQALRLAKGIDCDIDWELADILIGKIKAADGVLKWWFARSDEGDAEGHLVTGWLVRRQLALDPDQLLLERRMDLAREGGWAVPKWMNHPTGSQVSRSRSGNDGVL